MNRKFIVAILLVTAVSIYAHAQEPKVSKDDAQKVVTIISGDKAKTQAYCDIKKLSEQIAEASAKKDDKTVEKLSLKIETLEKALGPEYVALVDGLPDILGNDVLDAEFIAAIASLDMLCTR
jgi:peptidoglycan hydrolase CwlO-like protein